MTRLLSLRPSDRCGKWRTVRCTFLTVLSRNGESGGYSPRVWTSRQLPVSLADSGKDGYFPDSIIPGLGLKDRHFHFILARFMLGTGKCSSGQFLPNLHTGPPKPVRNVENIRQPQGLKRCVFDRNLLSGGPGWGNINVCGRVEKWSFCSENGNNDRKVKNVQDCQDPRL